MKPLEIQGHVHSRYTRVHDAFAEQFRSGREVGAAVAILVDGEPVVDLFAGHADPAQTRPWTRDTITHVYSVTKGMTAPSFTTGTLHGRSPARRCPVQAALRAAAHTSPPPPHRSRV